MAMAVPQTMATMISSPHQEQHRNHSNRSANQGQNFLLPEDRSLPESRLTFALTATLYIFSSEKALVQVIVLQPFHEKRCCPAGSTFILGLAGHLGQSFRGSAAAYCGSAEGANPFLFL